MNEEITKLLTVDFNIVDYKLHQTESYEQQINRLTNVMLDSVLVGRIKGLLWNQIVEQQYNLNDDSPHCNQVVNLLETFGYREIIANSAAKSYEKAKNTQLYLDKDFTKSVNARHSIDESISFIQEARLSWESGITDELMAITTEAKRPFIIVRPAGVINPFLDVDTVDHIPISAIGSVVPPNASTNEEGEDAARFLYDCDDLYETIITIQNNNIDENYLSRNLGLIKLSLRIPSLDQLCKKYIELSPIYSQIGVDECYNSPSSNKFLSLRHEEAEILLSTGSIGEARHFLRRGVVSSMRAKVWRLALGLTPEAIPVELNIFDSLKESCDRLDIITDELYLFDVQNVIDLPAFFVFEEELREVALCFSRDEWILNNSAYLIHQPILHKNVNSSNEAKELLDPNISLPPSGVQPFAGLALYNAPLCYLYKTRHSLYHVCRNAFALIWCKLNVFSSDESTLLPVCKTFESLLMNVCPKLFIHLMRIQLPPLQVAFQWIYQGFVNVLEIDQVLLLWDRILGYGMDTYLLAVLSAAIFVSRSESLLQCTNANDATIILQENSRLRTIPLLQMFLYSEKLDDDVTTSRKF